MGGLLQRYFCNARNLHVAMSPAGVASYFEEGFLSNSTLISLVVSSKRVPVFGAGSSAIDALGYHCSQEIVGVLEGAAAVAERHESRST